VVSPVKCQKAATEFQTPFPALHSISAQEAGVVRHLTIPSILILESAVWAEAETGGGGIQIITSFKLKMERMFTEAVEGGRIPFYPPFRLSRDLQCPGQAEEAEAFGYVSIHTRF
jgi:hypothetical protein